MNLHLRLSTVLLGLAALTVGCTNPPAAGAAGTSGGPTNWQTEPGQSSINFVTTKAGQPGVAAVSEVQTFRTFSGQLNKQGQIEFRVDLSSVDTGVEIRDERLRTMLFNVRATPQATFSSQIDPTVIRDLPATGLRDLDLNGQLTLAGQSKPVSAKLRMGRMGADTVLVGTRNPIVVNAADFGLRPGVEALREVMGLGFLSASVPVSFALLMREQR